MTMSVMKARSRKESCDANAYVVLAPRLRGIVIAASKVTSMGTAGGEEVDGHRCCR